MNILFLNSTIQQCGVYQYGKRLYDILQKCKKNNYMYNEIDSFQEYTQSILNTKIRHSINDAISNEIDVIIYNYNISTMNWLNNDNIQRKIKNIGIVHESPEHLFDIIISIDPTIIESENKYSIPRPIFENVEELLINYKPSTENINNFINDFKNTDLPIIGSFGFGFKNKGFDKIINIVNQQYDKAIIKFVIPNAHFDPNPNTFTDMVNICNNIEVKPGIIIKISNDFFSNLDILYFLKSNTINIFLYDEMYGRGISSVIDYAISVKKPLGISNSYMFRNIYCDEICLNITSIENCIQNYSYISKFNHIYSNKNVIEKMHNIVNLSTSYSQATQDLFVLYATQNKKNGFFLEIGSNHPTIHNNTYILEKQNGWSGLLVEYDNSFESLYKIYRQNSKYIINDARIINYREFLDNNKFPLNIDYLQLDLDVNNKSTLDTFLLLNDTVFDKYTFATITIEHDIYTGNFYDTKNITREILKNRGYILVFPDVSVFWEGSYKPFEDWYIHPDLIDIHLFDKINSNNESLNSNEIKKRILNINN